MRNIIAAFLLAFTLTLSAQENTNVFQTPSTPPLPVGPASFIGTVGQWLTVSDTNNVWDQKLSISAGIDSIQGGSVNLANSFRIGYDFIPLLGIESVTRDSGVQGTIVSEQVGLALNVHHVDMVGSLYLDGGYNKFQPRRDRLFLEIGLRVSKKVSRFVFVGIGIGEQFPAQARVLSAFTGIVF
jgi:hypothetical protein